MRGLLIAFEGLDQSGKQTQAERLKAAVEAVARTAVLLDFPSYETQIGDVLALEASPRVHGRRGIRKTLNPWRLQRAPRIPWPRFVFEELTA